VDGAPEPNTLAVDIFATAYDAQTIGWWSNCRWSILNRVLCRPKFTLCLRVVSFLNLHLNLRRCRNWRVGFFDLHRRLLYAGKV